MAPVPVIQRLKHGKFRRTLSVGTQEGSGFTYCDSGSRVTSNVKNASLIPTMPGPRPLGFPLGCTNDSGDFHLPPLFCHMNEFKGSTLFLAILDMAEFV